MNIYIARYRADIKAQNRPPPKPRLAKNYTPETIMAVVLVNKLALGEDPSKSLHDMDAPSENVLEALLLEKCPGCAVVGDDGVTRWNKPFGQDIGGLRSAQAMYKKLQEVRREHA